MEPETGASRTSALYWALLSVEHHMRCGDVAKAREVADQALARERAHIQEEVRELNADDDGGNAYGHIADDEQMEAVPRCGLDAFSNQPLGPVFADINDRFFGGHRL